MNEANWIKNKFYTSIQSLLLVLSLAMILGLMGWLIGGEPLALMAVGAVVLLYLIHPMVSPQVILRLHRARCLHYHEAPHLFDKLQALAERTRLPHRPMLYYSPAETMTAFTVGNRKSVAIVVSEGLLRRLDFDELSGVFAHEISHLRHNDMRIMGFAAFAHQLIHMLSLIGQFLLILNLPLLLWGQYKISWSAIFLLIFAPSISAVLQLALSRTREYRADIGAAELLGDGRALASALAKMDRYQDNFFRRIVWPVRPRIPEGSLLRTHPPTRERIRRLLAIQNHQRPVESGRFRGNGNRVAPAHFG